MQSRALLAAFDSLTVLNLKEGGCVTLAYWAYARGQVCRKKVLGCQDARESCRSHSLAGSTPVHIELERTVARYLQKEAAITFGMGFATNSMVIPALVEKGCLVISDALNHASIVAGVRGSGAKVKVKLCSCSCHLPALGTGF